MYLNSYTFHITLYDLASLGTIFIGLTFALQLWFTKSINQSANRFLALALGVMILWMARILAIDIRLETYLPGWDRLPMQFLLTLGPLIYFYVLKITQPEYKFGWKDLLHFSPVLLEQGALALEIRESTVTGAATYATPAFGQLNPVLQLLVFISIITYLYRSHKLISNFYRRLQPVLMDRSRIEFRWLRRLLVATALLWTLWIAYAAVDYFGYLGERMIQVYYPFYIFFAVMIIWTAAAAFLKPQAGRMAQQDLFVKPSTPAELREKGIWLKQQMQANKYYQDPQLSLVSLAGKLNLTTHELSRIINTALKKSFNDFINEYRIRDVASKMQDPAYDHITLLGIAYESGFNSKDTFIRAFKQLTGKTPANYKRELKKEVANYRLRPYSLPRQIILVPEVPQWSHEQLNYQYMFRNYFKTAFRVFSRRKLFTFINIVGLSIGTSAALVIYLIVHHDFTFDKFHKDDDRIYRVATDLSFQGVPISMGGVTVSLSKVIKDATTGSENSAPLLTLGKVDATIPDGSKVSVKFKKQADLVLADARYFNIFTYKWLAGAAASSLKGPYQAVLTSAEAKRYFPLLSYDQMLGKQIIYQDSLRTTITGVVESIRENTDLTFTDFISYSTGESDKSLKGQLLDAWDATSSAAMLFVKLSPGTTAANFESQINALLKKNNPPTPQNKGNTQSFHLQPLSDIHFDLKYGSIENPPANKNTLYGLMAIAAFLLLLACINFINLTTAQASQRAKEIGIRKTMGGTRFQLIGQFLSETFLVTVLAVAISIALVPFILKLFAEFISKDITTADLFQPAPIVFILLLIIAVSLISGFYPAMILSNYKPVSVLKNDVQAAIGKSRNAWLRKSLTVTQFIVAQFFIMATVMVSKQIHYALNKDLGYKKDAIVFVVTPFFEHNSAGKKQVFMNKIRAIPQISLVSQGEFPPSSDGMRASNIIYLDGKREITTRVDVKFIDENYLKVYQIKLLAGRALAVTDTNKRTIINSTFAKILGFKNPQDVVGKIIQWDQRKAEIVGVTADFYQQSLHDPIKPLAMVYHSNTFNNNIFHLALKPQTAGGDEWKTAIVSVGRIWKEIYPDDDFDYQFYDDSIAKFYENDQHTSKLLGWATGLSVLISCLGLMGLVIYNANLRVKEIGVRKVLGASVRQIVVLLSLELVILVIIAFVIVTPLAWWAVHKWIQNFADRTPISWWIFALSGAGMLLATLFTLSFQTIKAALANPVKSLRSE